MSPRIASVIALQLSQWRLLSFEMQHHDWAETFSRLRVRGPFQPIRRSRSMGPDPTERGSIGDVRNDASTQGSFRAQTLVLSQ